MKKFIIILVFVPFIFLSCGKKDTNTQIENKSANQNEQNTSNKQNANTSDIEMSKGLPKDYPSDIPIPPQSTTSGYFKSSEGTIVNFTSGLTVNELRDYYKNVLKQNGFTQNKDGETFAENKLFVSDFVKNNKKVNIAISRSETEKITAVVITY